MMKIMVECNNVATKLVYKPKGAPFLIYFFVFYLELFPAFARAFSFLNKHQWLCVASAATAVVAAKDQSFVCRKKVVVSWVCNSLTYGRVATIPMDKWEKGLLSSLSYTASKVFKWRAAWEINETVKIWHKDFCSVLVLHRIVVNTLIVLKHTNWHSRKWSRCTKIRFSLDLNMRDAIQVDMTW